MKVLNEKYRRFIYRYWYAVKSQVSKQEFHTKLRPLSTIYGNKIALYGVRVLSKEKCEFFEKY